MYEIKDKPLFERTYIFKHYIEIICDIDDATTLPNDVFFNDLECSIRDMCDYEDISVCEYCILDGLSGIEYEIFNINFEDTYIKKGKKRKKGGKIRRLLTCESKWSIKDMHFLFFVLHLNDTYMKDIMMMCDPIEFFMDTLLVVVKNECDEIIDYKNINYSTTTLFMSSKPIEMK